MKRRDLLRNGIALGSLSLAGGLSLPKVLYASPSTDRYFIFVWFQGAWDILLGLDPRDPQEFNEERLAWTRIQTGYDRLPAGYQDIVESSVPGLHFGPYIGGLNAHADKLAVIRGMSMETLGHAQGMRRFLTGKPPVGLNARGSSMGTVIADLYGAQKSIPNLCVGTETYNDGLALEATGLQVDTLADLLQLLEGTAAKLSTDQQDLLDQFLVNNVDSSRSVFMEQAIQSHLASRVLLEQELHTEFDFNSSDQAMVDIRNAFELSDPDDFNDPNVRMALAVKALTGGLSRCVTLKINTSSLDTHDDSWEDVQGPRQQGGFDAIGHLINYLQSTPYDSTSSWFDHTTILGFSEFSRTTLLNSRGGRDHSLTNAAFLAGAGIKPGLYGASSDVALGTQAVDLSTGTLDPAGQVIRPEHIHRALIQSLGYTEDIVDFRVDPLTAMLL